MGKPKKQTTQETKPVEKTNTTPTQGIGYQGKIDVQIRRGDKVISSNTYKNTGTNNLFKFLGNALLGVYNVANKPLKVALFNRSVNSGTDIWNQPNSWQFTNNEMVTPEGIAYTNTAFDLLNSEEQESLGTSGYKIQYEFKIPFSYITGDIYKAALYPNQISNLTTDKLAFFGFTGSEDWNEITKPTDGEEYTLLLVWTLTISNK